VNDSITILTSIYPARVDSQQEAITSWQRLGFAVVSLNLAGESEGIRNLFPGVSFVTVNRPSDEGVGSRIYLREIFACIQRLPGLIFGIVNSDIVFMAKESFREFIARSVGDGLIFGSRLDMGDEGGDVLCGKPPGFDYFFFNRNILFVYPDTRFCLGMPVWDYWFPLMPLLAGCYVTKLESPVAYHRVHPALWGDRENEVYWRELQTSLASFPMIQPLVHRRAPHCEQLAMPENFAQLQLILNCNTGSVYYADAVGNPGGAYITEGAYSSLKSELLGVYRVISRLEAEKEAILSSGSWRLTKPLRSLKAFFMGMRFHGEGNDNSNA